MCANGSYGLDATVSLWTDVEEFERLAAAGAQHEAAGRPQEALDVYCSAALLYRGDLLGDDISPEWASAERSRLHAGYLVVGNRLGELHAECGDHSAALAICAKVLERDAWNEEATCTAMKSYVAVGNRSQALALFKSFEQELDRELGVAPSAEACALYHRILTPMGSTRLPAIDH